MGAVPDETGQINTHTTAEPGALKSFRLTPFDPAKPDTYKGWEAALLAGVSDSTAAAIRLESRPRYGDAMKSLGPHASEDQVGELMTSLSELWDKAQAEAYRVITLSVDFKSPKGKVLLDRISRHYSKERNGIDLLLFMRRKYASHLSFSKQQLLIDKLRADVLAAEIAEINNPDEADDYLTALYGDVWLEIMGNKPSWPMDFVRRVLVAMATVEGKVSQLAFTHTCALDAALHTCDEAEWAETTNAPSLNKIYLDAELFISAVAKSWPVTAPGAFTLKRTRAPRDEKRTTETSCKTCNCRGCDGNPCYALNPGRKLDAKLTQAQVKFINIARAYVAKHGAAGLKNVAFSVWKKGGDAPGDDGKGTGAAKATRSEEAVEGDDALNSQLGEGAVDPDTLVELLAAAGFEIEAEVCDECTSPMLCATQSQPEPDAAMHVQDMLERGGDVESTTEQLMRMADTAEAERAASPPSSHSSGPRTPPSAAMRAPPTARAPVLSPSSLAEFARRLENPPAAEASPAPAVARASTGEHYRDVIRALVESHAAVLRGERSGAAALADVTQRLGGWRVTVWHVVQGVALLHLADSVGAGLLARRAAAKAWLVARSLGGKAAEALLHKFLSIAHAITTRLYLCTSRGRQSGAPPATQGGLAFATRGARDCTHPRAGELCHVLTDNCATENITQHLSWLLPDTITNSTVGRYQGCEQGGGVVATKEGIVPMLVPYTTADDNTLRTGLILRRWQYSPKLDSSLYSEAYERSHMQSLFVESRGDNGQVQRAIHLANGWRVPLKVNAKTGISRLTLLCSPARLVTMLGGATPRGQLSAHIKLEAPPPEIMSTADRAEATAHAVTKEFECVSDASTHPLRGSLLLMATNVGMSRVKLSASEFLALKHQELAHAPVHRIIMTGASQMLSGMGNVASLKPADVRAFMLAGCDICNAAKLKRPPVPGRPSGMAPPQTEGARGDEHRNRVDGKTRVEFDTFGPVNPPSIEGYTYARQFYIKELVRDGRSWLRAGRVVYGSKSKTEADATLCLNRFLAELGVQASECDVLRVDDAKETKGREFCAALAAALIHGEINPGYMHHMLGGCEVGWYVGVTGAIANLKNYGDDKRHWFTAMMHAFAAEDVLATKDADGKLTSAYFRRTGRTGDGSVLAPYGCPVRYLVDKSLRSKFDEHAAAGKYRGPSRDHLSSVRLSSKNGTMLDVHAGMVVPDTSAALLPHSPAMREYAESAAANAERARPASSPAPAPPPAPPAPPAPPPAPPAPPPAPPAPPPAPPAPPPAPPAPPPAPPALPAADASQRARRSPQFYGSYGTNGSYAPGQGTLMLSRWRAAAWRPRQS